MPQASLYQGWNIMPDVGTGWIRPSSVLGRRSVADNSSLLGPYFKKMKWHSSVERLLQRYCDEAQVRESLHRRGYYWYKRALTCFQLPIIILSAMSGSLQFLSKSYPQYESNIVTGTASLSIGVSIVSAVMTYLKLGEAKTKHEISQVAWQNFFNTVSHQLSLARSLREDPENFLTAIKTSYDRLFEISPICSRKFILDLKKLISKVATDEFQVPPYLNGFSHTHVWTAEDSYESNDSLRLEVEPQVPEV